MDERRLRELLTGVRDGSTDVEGALKRLRHLPFENIGCATLDHHRQLRQGLPEVIFCEHKAPGQVAAIAKRLSEEGDIVLGTRATSAHFEAARASVPSLQWNEIAGAFWLDRTERELKPGVVVISAGTSEPA